MDQNEQTEAVFKSSRTEVDPVSGNEVPPGATSEEVRDDVPAMLSEGEYVVPADVLRYYGVKFFEDLRKDAKISLAEMESGGRIGGEPIEEEALPFSDEELATIEDQSPVPDSNAVGFATGGLAVPAFLNPPDLSGLGLEMGEPAAGMEFRTYVNESGMEVTIPFFNGEPLGVIPTGYTLKSDTPKEEEAEDFTPDNSHNEDPSEVMGNSAASEAAEESTSDNAPSTSSNTEGTSTRGQIEGIVGKGLTGLIGGPTVAIGDALTGGHISQALSDVVGTVFDVVLGSEDEEGNNTGKGGIMGTGYTSISDMFDGGGPGQSGNGDGFFGGYTSFSDMFDGGGPGQSGKDNTPSTNDSESESSPSSSPSVSGDDDGPGRR